MGASGLGGSFAVVSGDGTSLGESGGCAGGGEEVWHLLAAVGAVIAGVPGLGLLAEHRGFRGGRGSVGKPDLEAPVRAGERRDLLPRGNDVAGARGGDDVLGDVDVVALVAAVGELVDDAAVLGVEQTQLPPTPVAANTILALPTASISPAPA
jgi:hypothetical protein